jgi:hypothetical protein
MTEDEWRAATDVLAMVDFLRNHTNRMTARKLRLFDVACCRDIWNRLPDERSKQAIQVAERFADGLADR